ncbi:MAG: hypothetical protein QNK37_38805 [Acidobacteriota bacterium]|nr:hypothetical protein [Acidobacteriota bacterium]
MHGSELLAAFENLTLEPALFNHEKHVETAWLYVAGRPLPEAMAAYRDGLKRFSAHAGVPGKYHETITFALLMLVDQRYREGQDWDAFRRENLDLLTDWRTLLHRWYRPETLDSDLAGARYLLPDRLVEEPAQVAG